MQKKLYFNWKKIFIWSKRIWRNPPRKQWKWSVALLQKPSIQTGSMLSNSWEKSHQQGQLVSLLAVSGYQLLHSSINKWFSPDFIAALLVYKTKEEKVFGVFDLIIMPNMNQNLLLFCAPTWPSYHRGRWNLTVMFTKTTQLHSFS